MNLLISKKEVEEQIKNEQEFLIRVLMKAACGKTIMQISKEIRHNLGKEEFSTIIKLKIVELNNYHCLIINIEYSYGDIVSGFPLMSDPRCGNERTVMGISMVGGKKYFHSLEIKNICLTMMDKIVQQAKDSLNYLVNLN